VELLGDVVAWFTDGVNWSGPRGIPARTLQHLWLSVAATGLAAAAALPLALWLGHRRRAEFLANAVVNVGRAIPSFGVIIFLAVAWITRGWDIVFWPLVLSMVMLAVPPMFTNAYTGVANVDRALVEAGRGMGYTEPQLLRRVELPAAMPILLAGVRIAFVQVVATVALGAVITGRTGGLGVYIISGFARLRSGGDVEVLAGAILVALLTLLCERAFTLGEQRLLPSGLRPARRAAGAQPAS
jgi:osmoprotectant transport system permease protein